MATKLLVAPRYDHYFEVDAFQLDMLMKATIYKKVYDHGYKYYLVEESLDLQILEPKEIIIDEQDEVTLNIQTIMEENNRLTRENDLLKEKLKSKIEPLSKEISL